MDDLTEIYITKEQIAEAVTHLAREISNDYAGKDLLLAVLLRGSYVFAADLARALDIDVSVDFMRVVSYEGRKSTGEVKIIKDLDEHIQDRHVLVIEDIIDTGLTLSKILDVLSGRSPRSLEVCSLLNKPSKRIKQISAKYLGIEIEDVFVVGYGMDYDERYRHFPEIRKLKFKD